VLRFRVTETEYAALRVRSSIDSVTVSQLLAEAVAEYCSDLDESGSPRPFTSRTFINSILT
jgi:hypothetical protein